jgi:o-succinylbenzoate---CoA ligase
MMAGRPLHALLFPPAAGAGRLCEALAAALDGSGPAILPVDPRLPRAGVTDLLDAFSPDVVESTEGAIRWHPTARFRAPAGARGELPADTAVVIATSGSTGEPKGAQLSATALVHSARASLRRLGARPGDRWLCPLPTSHIAGLGVLVRSLVTGTDPVVMDRLEPAAPGLGAPGCAYASLVPTQLRRLLDAGADLAVLRAILVGGAAVPAGLLAAARAAGARVVTTYGMTETCGGCVYDGMPLDGVLVRTGDGGRIRIGGPVVFSGYRNRPDLTASALNGGWFVTADVGQLGPDGRLAVRGRADEMINTGGEKVAPAEVAAILEECPGVREAAVFGEPDPEWGERVTAAVVATDPAAPPSLADLRAAVRQRMPGYAAPKALLLVPAIPLLPSGKPDLAALRSRNKPAPQQARGLRQAETRGTTNRGTPAGKADADPNHNPWRLRAES